MTGMHGWSDLPAALILEIERVLESPVSTFTAIAEGDPDAVIGVFTSGLGTQIFVKAVPEESPAAADYRIESRVVEALPPSVPTSRRLLFVDGHGWVLLGFEAVAGRTPHEPWSETDLKGALDALTTLAASPTSESEVEVPSVVERMAGRAGTWRSLLEHGHSGHLRIDQIEPWERTHLPRLAEIEADWGRGVAGDALLHFDLRHDNFLITETDTTVILDWGRASRGQSWVDLVCLLLESELEEPLAPAQVFDQHPLGQAASRSGVNGLLVALGSYWTHVAAQPARSSDNVLRRRQENSRQATMRWLQQRWS